MSDRIPGSPACARCGEEKYVIRLVSDPNDWDGALCEECWRIALNGERQWLEGTGRAVVGVETDEAGQVSRLYLGVVRKRRSHCETCPAGLITEREGWAGQTRCPTCAPEQYGLDPKADPFAEEEK